MNQNQTEPKPITPEQPTDEGLDETPCSRSSECLGPTHYSGCACHEKGWQNKWECAVKMAARATVERDDARRMWSIHQDRLAEACELIAEIMREEVNIADECEKFLRAYAPHHLFSANADRTEPEKG